MIKEGKQVGPQLYRAVPVVLMRTYAPAPPGRTPAEPRALPNDEESAASRLAPLGDPRPVAASHPVAAVKEPLFPLVIS
jgi:hypothetical protein